ncbi:VPS9 domain-containing protein [Entamoeba marina]
MLFHSHNTSQNSSLRDLNPLHIRSLSLKNHLSIMSEFIHYHKGYPLLEKPLSPLYFELLSLPYFKDFLIAAIRYGCTLILSDDTFFTSDYFLTHLVRRHPRGQAAISLNGFSLLLSTKIYIYPPPFNTSVTPHKMAPALFKNFPNCIDDNNIGTTGAAIDCVEVIGSDVIITPLGDIPVLKVERSFSIPGSSWNFIFDKGRNWHWRGIAGPKPQEFTFDTPIPRESAIIDSYLAKIVELESQESAKPLWEYLSLVVEDFSVHMVDSSIEQRGITFKKIINGVMKKASLAGIPTDLTTRNGLSAALVFQVFSELWPPDVQKSTGRIENVCRIDEELVHKIRTLQFLKPKDFEVDYLEDPNVENGINLVIHQLRKINSYKCPHQKSMMINVAFGLLIRVISLARNGSTVSADDLLPALVVVLLKSNIEFLNSNILFIESFMDVEKETSYYLATLKSALLFLQNLNAKDVGWSDQYFNSTLSFAQNHSNPFDFTSVHTLRPCKQPDVLCYENVVNSLEVDGWYAIELWRETKKLINENKRLKQKIEELKKEGINE